MSPHQLDLLTATNKDRTTMHLTAHQAAAYANINRTTIIKLIKQGKLKGHQQAGPRGFWFVTTPKAEIKQIVVVHAPKSGWKMKKHSNGHAAPPAKTTQWAAEAEAGSQVFAPKPPAAKSSLHEVFAFAALDAPVRQCLLELADRFAIDDLKLLLTL